MKIVSSEDNMHEMSSCLLVKKEKKNISVCRMLKNFTYSGKR